MGLDQYLNVSKGEETEQIGVWRKHSDLQGWMQQLAIKKGLVDSIKDFNCIDMQLSEEDIDNVEEAIKNSMLPKTTGFFFGYSYADEAERERDLLIFSEARDYSNMNWNVYYSCWW